MPLPTEGDVQELRHEAAALGTATAQWTDQQMRDVLTACPDIDFAAIALGMDPRPGWLRIILE